MRAGLPVVAGFAAGGRVPDFFVEVGLMVDLEIRVGVMRVGVILAGFGFGVICGTAAKPAFTKSGLACSNAAVVT